MAHIGAAINNFLAINGAEITGITGEEMCYYAGEIQQVPPSPSDGLPSVARQFQAELTLLSK